MKSLLEVRSLRDDAREAARAAAAVHATGDIPTHAIDAAISAYLRTVRGSRPPMVALSAAGTHGAMLDRAELLLSQRGCVVLTSTHAAAGEPLTRDERRALQQTQRLKILLADLLVILAPDLQLGTWLGEQARYARDVGKRVEIVASAESAVLATQLFRA